MPATDFYSDDPLSGRELHIWFAGAIVLLAFNIIPSQFLVFAAESFSYAFDNNALLPFYLSGLELDMGQVNSVVRLIYLLFLDWAPATLFTAFGIWFVQRKLHETTIQSLVTAASRFRWKRCFAGVLAFISVSVVFLFVQTLIADNTPHSIFEESVGRYAHFDLTVRGFTTAFFVGLPFVLFFAPIDAALQEMMFRGYLDKGLIRQTKNRHIAFVISAALFSLWHFGNGDMYFGIIVFFVELFAFGYLMSVIVSLDRGLEAAIGYHAANNVIFFSVAGYDIPGLVPTFFFQQETPVFDIEHLIYTVAFYVLSALLLAHWRFGVDD